jgi:hypothetical protein
MSDLEQELKEIREQYERVQAAFGKQSWSCAFLHWSEFWSRRTS